MDLKLAEHYAAKCVEWLAPCCDLLVVAGSIRRKRPQPADIDLVAIPKLMASKDLFGGTADVWNELFQALRGYVDANAGPGSEVGWISGADAACENFLLKLRNAELNVFCGTPETIGAVYLTYTGSKEHNIWLSSLARRRGMEWKAKSGLFESGKRIAPGGSATGLLPRSVEALEEHESQIYAALGLPWIPPADRENENLRRLNTR